MRHTTTRAAVLLTAALLGISGHCAQAQQFSNYNEFGSYVNGYQDDFTGNTLNPAWQEVGADISNNFQLTGNGTLLMLPAAGDPNKLLLGGTYSNSSQNVLALIRVIDNPSSSSDAVRGGITTGSNPVGGQGINLHFRQDGQQGVAGEHFTLLNDGVAWGSSTIPNSGGDTWEVGEWKWLRLVYDEALDQVQAKVWDAGNTPEPADFDLTWSGVDFGRLGLAGLVTNSGGGATFEVDYFLLQADGLPQIAVNVPEPTTIAAWTVAGLIAIVCVYRRRRS